MKRELKADAKAFKQAINHCRIALATGQMFNIGDIERYLGVSLGVQEKLLPLSIRDFNTTIVPQLEILHKNGTVESIPPKTPSSSVELEDITSVYEEHPLDKLNWLPSANPLQKAVLYPTQTKAAKDIIYRLFIEDRRAILLRASVGVGKTYMYGQVLRWLWDQAGGEFFKTCISPWPALVITKATIVEQTQRVLTNEFGLDKVRQCSVIHYDALRSSLGLERMIQKTRIVRDGYAHEKFSWIPFMHPRFIIIDECQAAKNEDSQQAKIITALGQIQQNEYSPLKLIFSSATPFTRVSEAKYMCVNADIPYKMI